MAKFLSIAVFAAIAVAVVVEASNTTSGSSFISSEKDHSTSMKNSTNSSDHMPHMKEMETPLPEIATESTHEVPSESSHASTGSLPEPTPSHAAQTQPHASSGANKSSASTSITTYGAILLVVLAPILC